MKRYDWFSRAPGRGAAVLLLAAAGLSGCADSTGSEARTEEVVVVLNSVDLTLTLVPLGSTQVRTIGLGADGTPTTLAVRDSLAAVPMGITDVVALVNLSDRTVRTVPLPPGSGATGAAWASDSVVLVANPERNTVTPVHVRRNTAGAEIPVGPYPQALASDDSRVYVVNANLGADWLPAGPGSVTVLGAGSLAVLGTVPLTGLNPGAAAVRGARLFVLNAGTWGGGNSSLSVVDPAALQEERRVDGFGNFPGSVTAQSGRSVFVASYGTGVLEYDPEADLLRHGPENPLVPGGMLPVAAVRFDPLGLLYTLHPGDCTSPGSLVQMGLTGSVLAQADVGVCPFALGFGRVDRER